MAFAWEMGGEGTADIFRLQSGDVRIVRAWTDADPPDDELMALAGADSRDQTSLGIIRVPSRCLAIFWAPESGALIPQKIEGEIQEVPGTSVGSSAYVMSVEAETFVCLHDQVETESSQARRLTLKAIWAQAGFLGERMLIPFDHQVDRRKIMYIAWRPSQ